MNTEYMEPSSDKSFIPLTLISLSIIVFFVWQLMKFSEDSKVLQSNKAKLDDVVQVSIPKLDDQVAKSKQIQDQLEKLVRDLMKVAETDSDAKAIIAKYNIRQQAAPSPTPAY